MAVFLKYNWVRSILLQFLQKVFKFLARFGSSASTDAVVNLHRVVTSSTTRCFIRVAAFHHQSNPSSANWSQPTAQSFAVLTQTSQLKPCKEVSVAEAIAICCCDGWCGVEYVHVQASIILLRSASESHREQFVPSTTELKGRASHPHHADLSFRSYFTAFMWQFYQCCCQPK